MGWNKNVETEPLRNWPPCTNRCCDTYLHLLLRVFLLLLSSTDVYVQDDECHRAHVLYSAYSAIRSPLEGFIELRIVMAYNARHVRYFPYRVHSHDTSSLYTAAAYIFSQYDIYSRNEDTLGSMTFSSETQLRVSARNTQSIHATLVELCSR